MQPDDLFRVVYISRNLLAPAEVDAAVAGILAISRRNNRRDGVSGALLFNEDCFAQALEGPLAMVEAAFERIQCDPRHETVVVLEAGPVATREFAEWSMAYAGRAADPQAKFDALVNARGEARSGAGSGVRALLRGALDRVIPAVG